MIHAHVLVALLALLLGGLPAAAPLVHALPSPQPQPVVQPPNPLTPEIRSEVVDTIAAQLARYYAVADTGQLIADHLRRRLKSGAYDRITNPQLFAEALSTDMKAVNGDRHLSVGIQQPGMPMMPMGVERLPPLPVAGQPPAGSPGQLATARRSNFHIGRVEVLPGNVGYIEFRGFAQMAEAEEAVVKALRLLEHTDAMIIDVRDHMGGSGNLSNFLISHFFGGDSIQVLDVEVRAANQRSPRFTRTNVPGPRRPDVPLYVLTSRGTISAGEDFAFVMKNFDRATLVGETTTGAGRNNPSFRAPHGFSASISVSRVRDPRTGAEWEGTGVVPHIAVPPRTALTVAHAQALAQLAERTENAALRRQYEWTREWVEAEARKRPPVAALQKYAGVYGGERTVSIENGKLVYRRMPERLGIELIQISDSVFSAGPMGRLAFDRVGNGYRMRVIPPAGEPLVIPRTGNVPAIPSEY